jgi:hypothetical protein
MKNLPLTLITLTLFIGCMSEKRVQRYVRENTSVAENITNEFIRLNKVKGAEICIDVFPPEIVSHDTIVVYRDSIEVNKVVDTLYQWFTDNHYIDKVSIKSVLKPFWQEKIVTKTVTDMRYKVLYDAKINEYDKLQEKFYKIRKGFILTWAWIILICVGLYLFKRK